MNYCARTSSGRLIFEHLKSDSNLGEVSKYVMPLLSFAAFLQFVTTSNMVNAVGSPLKITVRLQIQEPSNEPDFVSALSSEVFLLTSFSS